MNLFILMSGIILTLLPSVSLGGEIKGYVEKGRQIYKHYCIVCHGEDGKGDGINAKEGMDPLPRDFTDGKEKYMVKRTAKEIFDAIYKGGSEIEKSALMPPFNNTLSELEIWSVAAYIRTLTSSGIEDIDFGGEMKGERTKIPINKVSISEGEEGDQRAGKKLYRKYGCSGCHKIDGKGGASGQDLTTIGSKLKGEQIFKVINAPRSIKSDSMMPIYGLDDDVAVTMTQYLMSLK